MDESKILIRLEESLAQVWDFGTPGVVPTQLPEESSDKPHLSFIDVREWLAASVVRVEDSLTGVQMFQLYAKYASSTAAQWDGQYLIAGYESGEVLILDFENMLPK